MESEQLTIDDVIHVESWLDEAESGKMSGARWINTGSPWEEKEVKKKNGKNIKRDK